MEQTLEAGGLRWWIADGAHAGALAAALPRVLDAVASGEVTNEKRGRRKELYRVRLADGSGPPDALLKVNHYKTSAGWRRARTGSKARHELDLAQRVAARGVPTPLPLAAGERREGGRLRSCQLLVPLVEGAVDLRRLWFHTELAPSERRALLAEFGVLSRQVCQAGVFQDDFAPNNFLVIRGDSPRMLMIDFERARLRRPRQAGTRFMLAKIDREMAGASAAERMRFLHAFCGGDRDEARRWWSRVRDYAPRLARRDWRRVARGGARSGRRFRVERDGNGFGFSRREASEAQLARVRDVPITPGRPFCLERVPEGWLLSYASIGQREAARLWATARWLHARRLGAEPVALWCRPGLTALLVSGPADLMPLAEASGDARLAPTLRVLLDRLLALGELRAPPEADWFLAAPGADGRLCVRFAAPHAVRLPGRADPGARTRAAVWAAQLAS